MDKNTSISILLVEDNPDDVELLQIMLEDDNNTSFEVANASRISMAFDYLNDNVYDAILLDLSLPDSHGMETFDAIKMEAPKVPVLILTGHADQKLALEIVYKGGQDYLVKGEIDAQLLIRSIKYAIERNRLQMELARAKQMEAEAQRLRDANQMTATIAHEFNNPLAIIKGMVDLVKLKNFDHDELENALTKINSQVKRMHDLVQKLIELDELREISYTEGRKIFDLHQGSRFKQNSQP